jgi:hypothetical protein
MYPRSLFMVAIQCQGHVLLIFCFLATLVAEASASRMSAFVSRNTREEGKIRERARNTNNGLSLARSLWDAASTNIHLFLAAALSIFLSLCPAAASQGRFAPRHFLLLFQASHVLPPPPLPKLRRPNHVGKSAFVRVDRRRSTPSCVKTRLKPVLYWY